jgi:hypothetical protein
MPKPKKHRGRGARPTEPKPSPSKLVYGERYRAYVPTGCGGGRQVNRKPTQGGSAA